MYTERIREREYKTKDERYKMNLKILTIIPLCLVLGAAAGSKLSPISTYLHFEDTFVVDLSEVIGYHQSLNALSADFKAEQLKLTFPNPRPLAPIKTSFAPAALDVKAVRGFTSQGTKHLLHFQNSKGEEVAALLTSEAKDGTITLHKTGEVVISTSRTCRGASLTFMNGRETLQVLCGEQDSSILSLCVHEFETPDVNCMDLEGQIKLEDLTEGTPTVRSIADEGTTVTLAYIGNAASEGVQSQFWILKADTLRTYRVPRDAFKIHKMELTKFSALEDSITILVSQSKGPSKDIFSLKIKDGKIEAGELEEVKLSVDDFGTSANKLVFTEYKIPGSEKSGSAGSVMNGAKLHVSVNVYDGAVKTFVVPQAEKAADIRVGSDFAVVVAKTAGKKNLIVLYDFSSEMHFLMDGEWDPATLNLSFSDLLGRGLMLAFVSDKPEFVHSAFGLLCNLRVTSAVKGKQKAELELKADGASLIKYSLSYTDFSDFEVDNQRPVQVAKGQKPSFFIPRVRGNGIALGDDKVLNFNEVGNVHIVEALSQCQPFFVGFEERILVMGCADGSLMVWHDWSIVDGNIQPREGQRFPRDRGDLNFAEVQSVRIFYNRFLVLLTGDSDLGVISLDRAQRVGTFLIVKSSTVASGTGRSCLLNNQGVICAQGPSFEFYNFEPNFTEESLSLKRYVLALPNIIGANVFNNFFDRYYFSSLSMSELTGETELHGWNFAQTDVQVDYFPTMPTQDAKFKPVTNDVLLLIGQDSLDMSLVVGSSILLLPFRAYAQDFSRLVSVTTVMKDSVFAIVYETSAGALRAAIMRATFDPARRLISDFEVSPVTPTDAQFKIRKLADDTTIAYFHSAITADFKMWQVFPEGPVFLRPADVASEIYRLNSAEFTFKFDTVERKEKNTFKLAPTIHFQPSEAGKYYADIETEYITITGDLKKLTIDGSQKVTTLSRVREISSNALLSSDKISRKNDNINIEFIGDECAASYQNRLLLKAERSLLPFDSCKLVNWVWVAEEETPFFLCRSETDLKYVLTDRTGFNLEFGVESVEPALEIGKAFLVGATKESFHLLFNYHGSKVFKFVSVVINSKNVPVIMFDRTFSVHEQALEERELLDFSMVYDSEHKECHIVFFPLAGDFILVKTVSMADNNFMLDFESVRLVSPVEQAFYAAALRPAGDGAFRVFLAGKVHLVGFKVRRTGDTWAADLETTVVNPLGNNLSVVTLDFTEDYLVVLQEPASDRDSLVFFRLNGAKSHVVQTLGSDELQLEYIISGFAMKKLADKRNLFALGFLAQSIADSSAPTAMHVRIFELGPFFVGVEAGVPREQDLSLTAEFMDGTTQKAKAKFALYPPAYGYLAHLLILVILLLALAVISSYAFKFYKQSNQAAAQPPQVANPLV